MTAPYIQPLVQYVARETVNYRKYTGRRKDGNFTYANSINNKGLVIFERGFTITWIYKMMLMKTFESKVPWHKFFSFLISQFQPIFTVQVNGGRKRFPISVLFVRIVTKKHITARYSKTTKVIELKVPKVMNRGSHGFW